MDLQEDLYGKYQSAMTLFLPLIHSAIRIIHTKVPAMTGLVFGLLPQKLLRAIEEMTQFEFYVSFLR